VISRFAIVQHGETEDEASRRFDDRQKQAENLTRQRDETKRRPVLAIKIGYCAGYALPGHDRKASPRHHSGRREISASGPTSRTWETDRSAPVGRPTTCHWRRNSTITVTEFTDQTDLLLKPIRTLYNRAESDHTAGNE
jgi:hypothetical protein